MFQWFLPHLFPSWIPTASLLYFRLATLQVNADHWHIMTYHQGYRQNVILFCTNSFNVSLSDSISSTMGLTPKTQLFWNGTPSSSSVALSLHLFLLVPCPLIPCMKLYPTGHLLCTSASANGSYNNLLLISVSVSCAVSYSGKKHYQHNKHMARLNCVRWNSWKCFIHFGLWSVYGTPLLVYLYSYRIWLLLKMVVVK